MEQADPSVWRRLEKAEALVKEMFPIVRRTAEHFEGTDAPLGKLAAAILAKVGDHG
jgi:hypothetical protein